MQVIAKTININGIVQGVGFRPFIYQLAQKYYLSGEVANTAMGVSIYVEGLEKDIDSFCSDIVSKKPPLAQITTIDIQPALVQNRNGFHIFPSQSADVRSTCIAPDASVCDACLHEFLDPNDRRYLYPFINCTNCGPRYTIIEDIPYDRPKTSMKHFLMCNACSSEYNNPGNRRFHAQPNACPLCGPYVTLYDSSQHPVSTDDPISHVRTLLKQGFIIAIKGIGGFHLAVDAENEDAVCRLREKKLRIEKPFALMSFSIEQIVNYAHVRDVDKQALLTVQRPIVLLSKKENSTISKHVAPNTSFWGVMLAYTPIHVLLTQPPLIALVMTSGNLSEEPIVISNDEAFSRLSPIADFFMIHNRDIYVRTDDSIVRHMGNDCRVIRRSRGYVPTPILLKHKLPHVLACGAELKNTICLTKDECAFLSQHIGDIEHYETYVFFQNTIQHMQRILDIQPRIIAYDLHPNYLSTQYALEQDKMVKIGIQHHHAHIVSCMAENQVDGPVIGLAFDGTGYGTDGHIWGGEILIGEYDRFIRFGHLAYTPMIGGNAAIKSPWRMAISYLYDVFGHGIDLPFLKSINSQEIGFAKRMREKKINTPLTSSLGRLFDGVASMIGLRNHVTFEGQAAIELEMIAKDHCTSRYEYSWSKDIPHVISISQLIEGIVQDLNSNVSASDISTKFHCTLIDMFADFCVHVRNQTGLNRVVLSGGVFQNAILFCGLINSLSLQGFEVITHRLVPVNDGGISLGQAVISAFIAKTLV
ncbi:MAG: carbamoyltransferase HypF [Desulfobacterales bacterium]|nr:carbamoyltransferase HypF [Desulfobacterales bacterium]